jgi:hypothetical protein
VASSHSSASAGHVAACAGTYDGARFVGGEWSRLVFGTAPYATSLFQDRYRRPCMISWLREDPDLGAGKGWSGAYSLVSTLAADAHRHVIALPHPDVVGSGLFADEPRGDAVEVMPGVAHHLQLTRGGPTVIEVRRRRECLARVTRARDRPALVIERPGRGRDLMPCGADSTVELFVDADILELFGDGVYGAWRLASTLFPLPGHET